MKQTPIQTAIEKVGALNISNDALFVVRECLKSLLPYERECIEGAYDAGIATTSGMQTSDFKCGTKYYSQTFNQNNPQGGGGK